MQKDHIPVRIVPLFPSVADVQFFTALFGRSAFVDPRVFTHTAKRHANPVAAPAPWALLLLGGLLVVLLAGNERWNGRLELEGAAA